MQYSVEQIKHQGAQHRRGDIIVCSKHLVKSSLISTIKVVKTDNEMENRKWDLEIDEGIKWNKGKMQQESRMKTK